MSIQFYYNRKELCIRWHVCQASEAAPEQHVASPLAHAVVTAMMSVPPWCGKMLQDQSQLLQDQSDQLLQQRQQLNKHEQQLQKQGEQHKQQLQELEQKLLKKHEQQLKEHLQQLQNIHDLQLFEHEQQWWKNTSAITAPGRQ